VPVAVHPDRADDRKNGRDDGLREQVAAEVRDPRADEGRDAEHQQIESAGHQFRDDEDEAGDQPGEGKVHRWGSAMFLW